MKSLKQLEGQLRGMLPKSDVERNATVNRDPLGTMMKKLDGMDNPSIARELEGYYAWGFSPEENIEIGTRYLSYNDEDVQVAAAELLGDMLLDFGSDIPEKTFWGVRGLLTDARQRAYNEKPDHSHRLVWTVDQIYLLLD